MRLMTLNTHSLVEDDHEQKLRWFVSGLLSLRPDVVALQEVNQSIAAPPAEASILEGYVPAQSRMPIRADNYAAHAARLLQEAGVSCAWTYLPMKRGYDRYDEGLALLALDRTIDSVEAFRISSTDSYQDWRTRWALCMRLQGIPDWFYSVHMGWWWDVQEPFMEQWQRLNVVAAMKARCGPVWLMGDFNAPAHVRGEGYDAIVRAGWYDTFDLAKRRDGGVTVSGPIDGWREESDAPTGMRIDMIWRSQPEEIESSRVVFSGQTQPIVSDHYGVLIQTATHAEQARRRDS